MPEEQDQEPPPEPSPTQEPERMSLADFLESVPPSQMRGVDGLVYARLGHSGPIFRLTTPDISLHCGDNICGGTRIFRPDDEPGPIVSKSEFSFVYVRYVCSNCQKTDKTFSIAAKIVNATSGSGLCYKFGELPPYGPPTSSRLVNLIGPDREMFLRGRRCETQGLGIGAFVYYRRVVENQKNRILGKIIQVSETLATPADMIARLKAAQQETQFSKAMQSVKDAIPSNLRIKGQNPLTLLHAALSDGLHEKDDEACMSLAHAIRVVLSELSDRIDQTLKDERELNEALALLAKKRDI